MLVLSGSNMQTSGMNISEGTVRLSGASSRLGNANGVMTIRQGATLDLNGVSTGDAIARFNNNGTVTNSAADTAATLTVGDNSSAGTSYGVLQDGVGGGVLNVTKVNTSIANFLGLSTFTGTTRIGSTGSIVVDVLADIGQPSGIGSGTSANNAGSLIFDGAATAVLIYRGTPTDLTQGDWTFASRQGSTNRLFTLAGSGATLESNASLGNAIVWSNPAAIAFGTSTARRSRFRARPPATTCFSRRSPTTRSPATPPRA